MGVTDTHALNKTKKGVNAHTKRVTHAKCNSNKINE